MNSFEFYNPTKVIFGPGRHLEIGGQAKKFGKKALIVTTRGSVARLGILDRVKHSLSSEGIDFVELSGVDPNPRMCTVVEGVELCKRENVDILIAVGGGSVIDCAKAIGFCLYDDGDPWDFFTCKREAEKSLPVLTVLTISGTGSEMNTNCVITNEKLGQKYATHYEFSFPKVSIIDPELMISVPKYLTASGMVDTISHVVEKYFDGTPSTPVQDRLAEGVILTVIESESVLEHPEDPVARGNLAWASTMALNGLNDAGRGSNNYDAHTIELELSAKYDVAHGAGLAVVQPAWLKHVCKQNPDKFVQFAKRIFGISGKGRSDVEIGHAGIAALTEKYRSWSMPTTLKEIDVPKDDLRFLAKASTEAPEGSYLIEDEIYQVLLSCYE